MVRRLSWTAAVVSLVVVVIGIVVDVRRTAAVFLVAYAFAVSVALGMLAMIMIAHLTNATWFSAMRRRAERVLRALPFLAGIGLLVLLALPVLYVWTRRRPVANVDAYLNVPFFIARYVVYWVAWLAIARGLASASRLEDAGDCPAAARRARRTSAAGLIVLGLTMTFAAFDWMMSLTPDWYSTIYGVYWFAGGMVGALALLALPGLGSQVGADPAAPHRHALAGLLLTFVLFWVYIAFAQYVVIWSGGLPREVTWYVARVRDGWAGLAVVLLFGMFVLPLLALMVRDIKRSRPLLAALATILLALHYLDTLWVILPGLVPMTWFTALIAAAMLILVTEPAIAIIGR